MFYAKPKSLIIAGIFVVVAVAALYVFSLFQGAGEQQSQSGIAQAEKRHGSSFLPDGVKQVMCSPYAGIAAEAAPCSEALDVILKNYAGSLVFFGLMKEGSDGKMTFLAGTEPEIRGSAGSAGSGLPEGTKLRWYGVIKDDTALQSGANATSKGTLVFLDAKGLFVVEERPQAS